MRIVWQSFIDPAQHTDYFELLGEQLRRAAGPDTTVEVIGLQPPDTHLHRLTETRCAAQASTNALEAQRQNADAFTIAHFHDSRLQQAPCAANTPILRPGDAST